MIAEPCPGCGKTDAECQCAKRFHPPPKLGEREAYACNCRGPQGGQPVCPCMMKDVRIVGGRYVRMVDLGPVSVDSLLRGHPVRTPERKVSWKD